MKRREKKKFLCSIFDRVVLLLLLLLFWSDVAVVACVCFVAVVAFVVAVAVVAVGAVVAVDAVFCCSGDAAGLSQRRINSRRIKKKRQQ